ncbi:hypothetical protein KORDIASMS9_01931 [Kordia sp. SMS9]|uniref:energy transducer TonB n=1 Tax=Kordia sp. SMS9 TaxID=2282170 RepID=UPI000E0D1EF5|nr:energy transducer TonB [Kordia sp. SMS9]AXG69704.1 hypothetical protein KORDIASMS9_01931 [Kordia sp. SMS9]
MKNFFLLMLFVGSAHVGFAQKSTPPQPPPSTPFAEGCEDVSDPYYCTDKKLRDLAFEALAQSDIDQILLKTEKDTIFMNTKLYFYKNRELATDVSSVRFHERELTFFEVDLSFSLEDIPIKPTAEEKPRKTGFASYLFLKIDRENKKLIPLPDYEPERIPFSGPDRYIVYPGCESKKNNKDLRKCMSQNISKHVAEYFDTELATKLNLKGIQRIYVIFTVDKDGAIIKVNAKAPHPKLAREARRVVKLLPEMKPGELENTPIALRYTLPIIFKVQ